jgi:glycosyltransferase involved in cell wall biosynthesis
MGTETVQRPLRVTCAVPHSFDSAPAQRYRWEQWRPGLRGLGIDLEFVHFCTPELDALLRQRRQLSAGLGMIRRYPAWSQELLAAGEADVLIIARKAAAIGQPLLELWAARRARAFVYDFDDAIFLDPPGKASLARRLARARWRCRALCQAASMVLTGNEFLATFARQHCSQVKVIPTTVDTQSHVPGTSRAAHGGVPVVGWSGSYSTSGYVEQLLPLLRTAQAKVPFELLVVGASFDLQGVRGRCVPWTSATEVPLLQSMDIGLMPLDDSPWERGKCSLKALLYQAVGIPALVSDVGTNSEAVVHEQTGYLVKRENEWVDRLVQLLQSSALRGKMGARGREHVVRNYSAERWLPEIARALRSAAATARLGAY